MKPDGKVSMKEIRSIAKRIAEKFDIEKIILFGSYALGKADENSDVDLLVELNDSPFRISFWEYAAMAEGLQEMLLKKVDMVEEHLLHNWVKESVEKEKVRIV